MVGGAQQDFAEQPDALAGSPPPLAQRRMEAAR